LSYFIEIYFIYLSYFTLNRLYISYRVLSDDLEKVVYTQLSFTFIAKTRQYFLFFHFLFLNHWQSEFIVRCKRKNRDLGLDSCWCRLSMYSNNVCYWLVDIILCLYWNLWCRHLIIIDEKWMNDIWHGVERLQNDWHWINTKIYLELKRNLILIFFKSRLLRLQARIEI
jgi:hypothetical protein